MLILWVQKKKKRNFKLNLIFTTLTLVNESAVFTVDPTTSFLSVFGKDRTADPDEALRLTAKQVKVHLIMYT